MFGKKRRSPGNFKEEIASHLAHEADDMRDRGKCADPEAAARRAFGNVTKLEERSYESRHWMWFDHLRIDLRQAVRQLRKRPGFSAMVILILGLGIGANSAIFSVIRAVLLRRCLTRILAVLPWCLQTTLPVNSTRAAHRF
jgi:hypothetical protein